MKKRIRIIIDISMTVMMPLLMAYDKRLEALQKTVEIQAKMLAAAIEGDSDEVLKAVNLYTQALS